MVKDSILLVFVAVVMWFLFCSPTGPNGPKPVHGQPVTDIDGNVYQTVVIGSQTWMAENLKTTRYNDGTAIPLVTNDSVWNTLTTPGYCWYNNDSAAYGNTFGALYNWYAVNTGKLAPTGWHVPTDSEWTVLTTFLGDTMAGGKLKEAGTAHWQSFNLDATNETGFSALPGGMRFDFSKFFGIGDYGYWWSSTAKDTTIYSWYRAIGGGFANVSRTYYNKFYGLSVRCVRD